MLDDRLILKLYRLLEPGLNPDLEVSLFLADTGFADTPATAGAMTWAPDGVEPSAAAMLQAFVPSTGDAWAAMLGRLADDPAHARTCGANRRGDGTDARRARVAPRGPAFPSGVASVAETAAWRASAERQLALAVSALDGDAHERMVALAPAVTARFADTFGSATGEARVTRIHGDYHLGQLLARTDGWVQRHRLRGRAGAAAPRADALPPRPCATSPGCCAASITPPAPPNGGHAAFDAGAWPREARAALVGAYGGIGPAAVGLLVGLRA